MKYNKAFCLGHLLAFLAAAAVLVCQFISDLGEGRATKVKTYKWKISGGHNGCSIILEEISTST